MSVMRMRRINLLQVVPGLTVGGTEKMFVQFLPLFDNARYNLSVCCLKGPGALSRELEERGIEVEYLNMPRGPGFLIFLDSFRAVTKLVNLMKKRKIDIVHSYLFRANILCRIAAKLAGVPVVISSMRGIEVSRKYPLLMERLTSPLVDKFTAVSDAIRNYIIRKARIDSKKIVTIHNGIRISEAKVAPIERKEFGLGSGVAIVGVVARLAKEKGYPYLLNAARVVIKKYPEAHFLIVGDGPQREELIKLASNLGLNDHITFTGYRRDVLSVLALFDIFALATLWEGLPIVILEAMVMAKPVVTTNVMGNPEVVVNGVTGFLVPPRDPESLAERILELLKDENLRKRMGGAGRRQIEEKFTIKKMVSETERLYEELLAQKMVFWKAQPQE